MPFALALTDDKGKMHSVAPEELIQFELSDTSKSECEIYNYLEEVEAFVPSEGSSESTETTEDGRGPWRLDPASAATMDLDALNAWVIQRDASVEPFETKEEAVAFATADFAS